MPTFLELLCVCLVIDLLITKYISFKVTTQPLHRIQIQFFGGFTTLSFVLGIKEIMEMVMSKR